MILHPFRQLFILLIACASTLPAATEPGIVWEMASFNSDETTLFEVAISPAGRMVAVGEHGVIRTSDDGGLTWTDRQSGTQASLTELVWAGDRWVASGGDNTATIVTSPDGIDWTTTTLGDAPFIWHLNLIGGRVVATALEALTSYSPVLHASGESWVGTPANAFIDVVSTDTLHVATGESGILTSTNGTDWTTSLDSPEFFFFDLVWTGFMVLALGIDTPSNSLVAARSNDGITWTTGLIPGSTSYLPQELIWTGARFVAFGGAVGPAPIAFTSPDGVAWTHHTLPATPDASGYHPGLRDACWTGDRIVAVGSGGYVVTSELAAPAFTGDWTERHVGQPIDWFTPYCWDLATFNHMGTARLVILGYPDFLLTSDDGGSSFTRQPAAGLLPLLKGLTPTTLPTRKLLAVGMDGSIMSSADSVTWTPETSGTPEDLESITWFKRPGKASLAVAVGAAGAVLTSEDGVTWAAPKSYTTADLHHVCFGIPLFETEPILVAVGDDGTVITSPDGATWTSQVSGVTAPLNGVAARAHGFTAVGDDGTILHSNVGTDWTVKDSGTTKDLNDLTWTGSQLLAAGDGGTIVGSPDGNNWSPRHVPTFPDILPFPAKDIHAIQQINPDKIIAVGSYSLFLSSRPAIDFAEAIAHESPPPGQDGPDDDPNGDGITNLVAYGHGIPAVAPTNAEDLAALPRMLPPGEDGRLRLQLRVNPSGLGDLSYILEQSTTLEPGSWTEIFRQEPGQPHPTWPFPAHITSNGPDGTAIIELLEESIGARPAYFTRLRHELATP